MKERVTLTLDQGVLSSVDETIDHVSVKNRSHAVELLLRKALKGTSPRTAVILAGGLKGKPTGSKQVHGRPLLDYNIELCKRHGISHIILSIGSQRKEIEQHYGDGKELGLSISYLEEEHPLGTAGPLRQLRKRLTETFVVLNADELKDVNITRMFQSHVQHGAKATIALTTVEDPSLYGVAVLDGGKIVGFVEKPKKDQAPSKLINAGLYILEPEVLDLIPDGYALLEADVFPKLARQGDLYGYPFSGQWFDTETPERFERAKSLWKGLAS